MNTGAAALFSPIAVVLFVVARLAGSLRLIEDVRGLSPSEARQLDALDRLEEGLRLALLSAFDRDFLTRVKAPLVVLLEAAAAATSTGIPVLDLLPSTIVPNGPKWRPLTLSLDYLLWYGVASFTDALRHIVHTVPAPGRTRRRQLAILMELQGYLALVVELEPHDLRMTAAAARARVAFTAAEKAIGADAPMIFSDAASRQ